jgi:hypothetical protein
LDRSISRAINMMQVQGRMRQSILRTTASSSAHVHRDNGLKRWIFSLESGINSVFTDRSVRRMAGRSRR